MPPASFDHVSLNDWFVAILLGYVQRKDLGAVVSREFSVRLPKQRRRRLPDVLFVTKERLGIIKENHAEGAPDLIVEIVSPESESRDWRQKYLEYERAGVREYWVIDPMSRHVEVYFLSEGRYVELAEQDGKIISQVVPGFFVRTEWLWQKPRPHQLEVFRELGL
jgi:Uma2 family endonuclease